MTFKIFPTTSLMLKSYIYKNLSSEMESILRGLEQTAFLGVVNFAFLSTLIGFRVLLCEVEIKILYQ